MPTRPFHQLTLRSLHEIEAALAQQEPQVERPRIRAPVCPGPAPLTRTEILRASPAELLARLHSLLPSV